MSINQNEEDNAANNYNELFKKIILEDIDYFNDLIKDNMFSTLQGMIFIPTGEERGLNFTFNLVKSLIGETFPNPLDLILQQF